MNRSGPIGMLLAGFIVLIAVDGVAQTPAAGSSEQALLNQYCVTCHNAKTKVAGLALDTMDVEHIGDNAVLWEKVIRKIRTGMMPPSGARRPDRATLDT